MDRSSTSGASGGMVHDGCMTADERSRAPGAAVVGIILAVVLAVGVGLLRAINAEPAERAVEIAGAAAFTVVFAAPALLAYLGLRDRPALLVAAGMLELGLALISLFSYIGLLLVPPAVLFFVAAGNMRGAGTGLWRSIAAVLVSITLGTVAFLALFARDDPVCWMTDSSTGESVSVDPDEFVQGSSTSIALPPGASAAGCSSDSISTSEAVAAIASVAAMAGAGWLLSRPPPARVAPVAELIV